MAYFKYLVLIFACAAYVYGGPVVQKCKAGDGKCAKESAQAVLKFFAEGFAEYGMEALDPVVIKKTDASSQSLKLIITDYTVTGLKECTIKKAKFDKPNSKILVKLLCSPKLEGDYEMDGKLLILPLEGKGPIHVQLRDLEVSVEMNLEEIEKDGLKYWNIKNSRHSYELKDKADVVFDNLFGGNEVLGKAARDVIKESGNEIVREVGSPAISDILDVVIENINQFFHHVPISELTFD
ncbi:unnamed protein product [Leptosia nina]|uniref:Uncharacterized protein n=1 Tax=Leptosia nina TaxID=320188 RepID=A0AAV1K3P8_9NEOP